MKKNKLNSFSILTISLSFYIHFFLLMKSNFAFNYVVTLAKYGMICHVYKKKHQMRIFVI
jgi:hypothetical protein